MNVEISESQRSWLAEVIIDELLIVWNSDFSGARKSIRVVSQK